MSLSNERSFSSVFWDDPRGVAGTVLAGGCGLVLLQEGIPTEITAWNYAVGALALAGAPLILLAVRRAVVCARLSREGTEGRGRVTGIEQAWPTRSYALRYRFQDRSGRVVEGREFLSQVEAFAWREGDEGEIRFAAADSAQSVWLGRPYRGLEDAARAATPSPVSHPETPAVPAVLPSRRVLVSRSRSTRWGRINFCLFLFTALCLSLFTVQVMEGKAVDFAYVIYALVVAVLLAASVFKFTAGRREVAEQLRVLRDGILVHALVTRVEEKLLRGRGGFITWSMGWIVSYDYTDRVGVTHIADSGFLNAHEAARWRAGDRCPVFFDPHNAASSVWVG
jgi:hypothetical protein